MSDILIYIEERIAFGRKEYALRAKTDKENFVLRTYEKEPTSLEVEAMALAIKQASLLFNIIYKRRVNELSFKVKT